MIRITASLVIACLLAVNLAWAADIHAPAPAGGSPGHGTAFIVDPHPAGHGHDEAGAHCLHCHGAAAHLAAVAASGLTTPAATTPLAPPDSSPAAPPGRRDTPPERPPRA